MKNIWIILGLLVLVACGNANTGSGERGKATVNKNDFPYVTIPSYIQSEAEAVRYVVRNFWQPYLKAASQNNTLYKLDSIKFEEAYSKYAGAILNLEESRRGATAEEGQKAYNLISSSQKNLFATADSLYISGEKAFLTRLVELSEKYFYNPISPYLNEEAYIPALEAIMDLKALDQTQKLSYQWQLDIARMNRIGCKAADFGFVYKSRVGLKKGTLHNLKADYLLLYFNNPDCNACRGQQSQLFSSQGFARAFEEGKVKVLSMYIDEQADLWEKHHNEAPRSSNWIYARDPYLTLRNNELYGIRAIPSMYLLDKDKNVILKDATAEMVVQYFR